MSNANVFISYRTDGDPDRGVCDRLRDALVAAGHTAFVDRTSIRVGERWAETIERGIHEADYMVLLLSDESIRSDMVLNEVEIARASARQNAGRPRILPVRLAYGGPLPYPLGAFIDPLQQLRWQAPGDTDRIIAELLAAVAGAPRPAAEAPAPDRDHGPYAGPSLHAQPPTSLPPPGGTLDLDDPYYIARDADAQAIGIIRQSGGRTINIKGPRQIGKSSLLMRVVDAALADNRACVFLDFQLLDPKESADEFYRHFFEAIVAQLDVPASDDQWTSDAGPAQTCTRFMQKLLSRLPSPVTIACDEADVLATSSYRNEFFGMLRAWHNMRANPAFRKVWRRLDLILVTSTEPYLFIDDLYQSPFNVGEQVKLEDFSPAQVADSNRQHGSPFSDAECNRLFELTAGHPFLVRRALYLATPTGGGRPVDWIFSQATDDGGPFGDHLRRHRMNVQRSHALSVGLAGIVRGQQLEDGNVPDRLLGAGLVKREGTRVVPRCELYRIYFKERLPIGG